MAYTVSEVSSKMDMEERTLKYYASEGLLPLVERTASGSLKFKDKDFEWLELLSCLRNTGASLSEMKEFSKLYHTAVTSQRPNTTELYNLLSTHMKKAEKNISLFERNMSTINTFIEKTEKGEFLSADESTRENLSKIFSEETEQNLGSEQNLNSKSETGRVGAIKTFKRRRKK